MEEKFWVDVPREKDGGFKFVVQMKKLTLSRSARRIIGYLEEMATLAGKVEKFETISDKLQVIKIQELFLSVVEELPNTLAPVVWLGDNLLCQKDRPINGEPKDE